ncbi:MAG TPA: hypothetical protein VIV01_12440 [Hyphomicrobiaceae bacterium]
MLVGTGSVLAGAALDALWSPAAAQPAGQAPALGAQVLGPVLSQPGWNKWIQNGQVAPLYDGEIALLKAIPAAQVFGNAAEARARQIAAHVRTMQPNAEPAYVAAFLTFAGLQNSAPFREWHERAYEKYKGKTEYPSGDDPYIWGRDRIPIAAAWANVEIGRAVERLQLSGVHIHSFSRDTGARTADGVMEDYLFAHYRVICARLDGNESNPTEGARLAQIMFGRKDLTGMLNVVSRGYANPTDTALMHSRIANKDISLIKYVTDFQGDYKILLYGIGRELDGWIASNYPGQDVAWGLASGVRPLSRTSVRIGNLSGDPRNSTHGRGEATDIILAGPGAYQVVEMGRKAWSDKLWRTALSRLAARYGLRHLGPSINDWPHIDIDPSEGLGDNGTAQLRRWRRTIALEAARRQGAPAEPRLLMEPREVTPRTRP